jgi:RNA polymerase sigma-70 factor (ECF subfamily)
MTIEDALVEQARSGDRSATEELLRLLAPRVHAVCRRICIGTHDADDAAQEAMIAIVRGLPRFDGRSSLTTWVHRVTTNACLDELRRIRRRPVPSESTTEDELPESSPGPEDHVLGASQRRDLAAALECLPEEYRVAVVLRDVADLDYAEISETLSIPIGTVRSRIARGRGRLADLLAGDAHGNQIASRDVRTSDRTTDAQPSTHGPDQ